MFPEFTPKGLKIECPDGTVLEFGDDEFGVESSFDTRRPILAYARSRRIRWHMHRTPQGSSMWYWQDLDTLEEFSIAYENDQVMFAQTKRKDEEAPFRFVQTKN